MTADRYLEAAAWAYQLDRGRLEAPVADRHHATELEARDLTVYFARYLEDASPADVVAAFGCSARAVKDACQRTRKRISDRQPAFLERLAAMERLLLV